MSGVTAVGLVLGGLAVIVIAVDGVSWAIAKRHGGPSAAANEGKPHPNGPQPEPVGAVMRVTRPST